MDDRNVRIGSLLAALEADWAILSGAESVCYATGHAAPIGAGPSPFAGGPTLAIVGRDGGAALVAESGYLGPDTLPRTGLIVEYDGFGADPAGPSLERLYTHAVQHALEQLGVGGVVGIEPGTHSAVLAELLEGRARARVDLASDLGALRTVKTDEEIEQLRACATLTGVGQGAARAALEAGRTELEVFAAIRQALDAAEGAAVPLGVDLLSGPERSAEVMGGPGPRVIAAGDPVICDLVPRSRGYWGDSCLTWTVGPATRAYAMLYRAAFDALQHATATLRPGISAGAFADGVYRVVEAAGYRNPIHIGHGIGVASVEHPRLLRGNDTVLAAGMVLMVEPGAYRVGVGGARLERMFVLTEDGNEVLSPYAIAEDPTLS